MRRTRWFLAVAIVAGAFVPMVPSGAASKPTLITHNCYRMKKMPGKIMFACADGGYYVDQLQWSSWGRQQASGRGVFHRNNCKPSCAGGTFHEQSGTIDVRRRKFCGDEKVYVFTRATIHYDEPLLGSSEESFKLWCPL